MDWDGLIYLLGVYWPYLAVAALIGFVVGWRSFTLPRA